MCAFKKLFKKINNKPLEEMTEAEINKYINLLNKKIEEETVASRIYEQSDVEKDQLYEKIQQRDDALIYLEQKRED